VALDLHEKNTAFAVLPPGEREAAEEDFCETKGTQLMSRLTCLARKWPVVVIYEAGRMGYWLYRQLRAKRICCIVIDPGSIPTARKGQSKSDRLDARRMARLARAHVLVPISVPDEETEGVRELLRCHVALSKTVKQIKNRITSMLARHNQRCAGVRQAFSKTYRRWLANSAQLPTREGQLALQISHAALIQIEAQLQQVDAQLLEILKRPRYAASCKYLCLVHGVGPMVALGFLTSLQTPHRFQTANEVMSYYGLVPETCISGGVSLKQPRITRRGDEVVRWLLIQASWSYTRPIRANRTKAKLLADTPPWFQERIAKMEKRLSRRYRQLVLQKHKLPVKAVTAIAREMGGWLWALLKDLDTHGVVSFEAPAMVLPEQAA
jgi:transposase